MRSPASASLRGIFVLREQVEACVANGWNMVSDLNPHQVLVLPPAMGVNKVISGTTSGARDGP
jgi:hypothetical protein